MTNKVMSENKNGPECSKDDDIKQEWLLMWGANDLRQNGLLVDVTLIVEGKKIQPCHRIILAASSPYFRAMFTHDVVEKEKMEIELNDLDFASVSAVVDYLYTCKIDINDKNVQDLLTACSILQILGLHGKCHRYMQTRLSLQNSLEVYNFAKTLCCTGLQNDAFALIAKSFGDIVSTESFLNLHKDDLIDFLSADELSVEREEEIYEAVLAWLLHDITKRGQFIGEVFSHVRLALLSDEYLEECISKEESITAFPHIQAQITAVQSYKAKLKRKLDKEKKLKTQLGLIVEDSTSNDSSGNHMLSELATNSGTSLFLKENKLHPEKDEADSQNSCCVDEPLSTTQNDDELAEDSLFLESPFYEIDIGNKGCVVRIPLTVTPRDGMSGSEAILFTNGRRTLVFDPITKQYFGGVDKSTNTPEVEEDPTMPDMKNAEMCTMQNGVVYLVGGLEVNKTDLSIPLRSKLFVFDCQRLKWVPRASLPNARCMMGMGEMDGNLYVTGGKALAQETVLSSVQKYVVRENVWRETTEMITPVYGHGCASANNRLFVVGGKTSNREILSNVLFLDGETLQWTEAPSLQVPRFLVGITVLRIPLASRRNPYREVIYIVGGVGKEGILSSVEFFAPKDDQRWKYGEEFPGNRCAQTVTSINGNLCVIGGHVTERDHDGRFQSIQKYDAFILESGSDQTNGGAVAQWRHLVRHIRGITGYSCACAKVKIDSKKMKSQAKE